MSKGELTKKRIAASFKKLMEVKPFDSITVSDITSDCGLNRLTFYYHFEDKYALLNWIYNNEIILTFKNNLNQISWTENLQEVLEINIRDRNYYRNALAYDNKEFRRYMHEAVINLFTDIINDWVGEQYIDQEDSRFVSKIFAYGVVGMVVEWVENDMPESPERMVEYIRNLSEDIKLIAITRYFKSTLEGEEGEADAGETAGAAAGEAAEKDAADRAEPTDGRGGPAAEPERKGSGGGSDQNKSISAGNSAERINHVQDNQV